MHVRDVRASEAGAVLPELVVAASLTVLVGALTMSALVGPVARLQERLGHDVRRSELEAAADVIARVLRAARPGPGVATIQEIRPDGLTVTVGGPDAVASVAVRVIGSSLVLTRDGPSGGGPALPVGVLLEGVAPDALQVSVLGGQGEPPALDAVGATGPTVVEVTVRRDDLSTIRVVHLRDQRAHAGVEGW